MQKTVPFQVYNASAGSGKTFTLVKEYLKILLATDSLFRFQNILAITFTNKAAAEMKARVLKNLKAFSEGKTNELFEKISEEIAVSDSVLQQRSKRILQSILQNYSAFNITTIDAFTHRIIRNFSFDLGLSLNFDVEMDSSLLLEEAVDLLISKIGFDKNLTNVLIDYSLDKTDDDKSWDISRDLREFAKILLNENDAKHLKKLENKTVKDFTNLKKELQKKNRIIESQFAEIGKNGLEIISSINIEHNDFYRSMLPNHFKNLAHDFNKAKFFDQNKLRERIEENTFYSKSKPADIKTAIEEILPPLLELYAQSEALYQQYTLNNLILKSLIPLAVLKHINESLNELKEQNNIRLNAEFNQIISSKIKDEPAPFIYERLGEKFRYYFIDEMQDTSELQWQNLIPLIENSLISETEKGERGNLLLVGDAKQAIYRWRGGKAEQFIDLTNNENPFSIEKDLKNLKTNFRSFSRIIDFNNRFFTHISEFLDNDVYKELYRKGNQQEKTVKEGGFVQISFVEKDKTDEEKDLNFPKKVLEIIQNLDTNFSLRDVCVLVRKKKEGAAIANYLSEKKIPIISSDTLLLKNNSTVNFIINLLMYLHNNDDKESLVNALYFLSKKTDNQEHKHDFIEKFVNKSSKNVFKELRNYNFFFNQDEYVSLPFYDGIEYLMRSFNLVEQPNAFTFSFLDLVLEYQQKKDAGLGGFLEYWEKKKENLCITTPKDQNAVQIMTIHKSKGLEFPVVIYSYDLDIYREVKPKIWLDNLNKENFNGFDTALVDYSKKLNYIGQFGEELYNERKSEIQLDNLNLLYVALTRPIEQLYIVAEEKKKTNDLLNARFYSDFFVDFLKADNQWEENKNVYSYGEPKRIIIDSKQNLEEKSICQAKFISTTWKNHNISIVANASKLWDTEKERAIAYGNLMHEILSKIISKEDVEKVVNTYVFEGIITTDESKTIKTKIYEVVEHPTLEKHFNASLLVFNERELITNQKVRQIPDRIVIDGNKVVIIDYKTGKQEKKHEQQISDYGFTLSEIGYNVAEKLLVYIDSKVTIRKIT